MWLYRKGVQAEVICAKAYIGDFYCMKIVKKSGQTDDKASFLQ